MWEGWHRRDEPGDHLKQMAMTPHMKGIRPTAKLCGWMKDGNGRKLTERRPSCMGVGGTRVLPSQYLAAFIQTQERHEVTALPVTTKALLHC